MRKTLKGYGVALFTGVGLAIETALAPVILSGRILGGPSILQREGNVFLGIADQHDKESRGSALGRAGRGEARRVLGQRGPSAKLEKQGVLCVEPSKKQSLTKCSKCLSSKLPRA